MSNIPIALQLYTVRFELAERPKETIQAVAEIGYQGVEGGPPKGMSNQAYLELLADNGLALIADGTSPEELADDLDQVVERCAQLGIHTLMTGIGGTLRSKEGDWKTVVAELGEA